MNSTDMWIDKMNKFFKGRTVEGKNLEKSEIEFGSLVDVLRNMNEEEKNIVKRFEEKMIGLFINSGNLDPSEMSIEDGKVIVDENALVHNCPLNIEALEGISVAGLLCSEWFGYIESEAEGRFCTFLTAEKTNNYNIGVDNSVTLYFDSTHPLMKTLIKNDFFEYAYRRKTLIKKLFGQLTDKEKESFRDSAFEAYHSWMINSQSSMMRYSADKAIKERMVNKQTYDERMIDCYLQNYQQFLPEKIRNTAYNLLKEKYGYSDIILRFYDIVNPLSPAGSGFRDNPNSKNYYWKAIPGGIPSGLINGVRIVWKGNGPIPNDIVESIHKNFPRVTIFDKNNKVIPIAKIKK